MEISDIEDKDASPEQFYAVQERVPKYYPDKTLLEHGLRGRNKCSQNCIDFCNFNFLGIGEEILKKTTLNSFSA